MKRRRRAEGEVFALALDWTAGAGLVNSAGTGTRESTLNILINFRIFGIYREYIVI